jgi:REP-associated tyrosine transposase
MPGSGQSNVTSITYSSTWIADTLYQGTSLDVPKFLPFRRAEISHTENPALAAAMAIPVRHSSPVNIAAPNRTFFVSSSIAGKRNLLQSRRSAQLFAEVIYHYRSQHKFLLHDFVIMPNHFHVLITLGQEISVERAVQFIKGGFAFRAGKELGFNPPVWQRGFSEVRIIDAAGFERVREYIAQKSGKGRPGDHFGKVRIFVCEWRICPR